MENKNSKLTWLKGFSLNRQKIIMPQIYQFLQSAIVSVQLIPGEGLKEKDIIEYLGVSRTPIREAMLRLEDEGLIEIYPQSGTYVSKIKIESVKESQFIREAMECAVVRYAAKYKTDQLIKKLSKKLHGYEDAMDSGDQERMFLMDEEFHRTLADFCFQPRLWRITNLAKSHMDRVRHLSLTITERQPKVLEEHKTIFKNIIDSDQNQAEKSMREHLNYFIYDLERIQSQKPEYFSN
jgi:GntR family transcriptional regulator, rspAB operon transcriptional repressor